jgi:hypothetical protein
VELIEVHELVRSMTDRCSSGGAGGGGIGYVSWGRRLVCCARAAQAANPMDDDLMLNQRSRRRAHFVFSAGMVRSDRANE